MKMSKPQKDKMEKMETQINDKIKYYCEGPPQERIRMGLATSAEISYTKNMCDYYKSLKSQVKLLKKQLKSSK